MKILMIYCFIMTFFVVFPLTLKISKESKAKQNYLAFPHSHQVNIPVAVGGKMVLNGGKVENSLNRR